MTTQLLPNYPDLAGKVAFVTGGSRGIGAETARLLAANGVRVAVSGRDQGAINDVVNDIYAQGGEAVAVPADATSVADLAGAQRGVEDAFGPVEFLIAFAGAGGPTPTIDLTPEQWHSTLDVNLNATFLTVKAFLPAMLDRGSGAIVTMASTAGRLPGMASSAYAASKAGIVMFSRHLANEVGPQGVRVNCVAPGSILTERNKAMMPPDIQRQVADSHPLRRLGTPQDVALATLFLCSQSSSWITGITLDISGGKVMI